MPITRSALRTAVLDGDLPSVVASLARRPSRSVLLGAASDAFVSGNNNTFRRAVLEQLVEAGLDPNDTPPVPDRGGRHGGPPLASQDSLRANAALTLLARDWGLPLASRAALVDPQLLDWLLARGANPWQPQPRPSALTGNRPFHYGSAWSCAAALVGTPVGVASLEVLLARHPESWPTDPSAIADVMGALVCPAVPTAAGPLEVADATAFLEATASRWPDLDRAGWKEVFSRALPWSSTQRPPAVARRMGVLIQALPPHLLAGMFDAFRAHGQDARGLAVDLALAGDSGPWAALHAQAALLGLEALPHWQEVSLDLLEGPTASPVRVSAPVGGLGYLLLLANWPGFVSPERVAPWIERFVDQREDLVAGLTWAQARFARGRHGRGAPLEFLAADPAWWVPNPRTGQTAAHACVHAPHLLAHTSGLAGVLDFRATDHAGNEGGAWLLARATLAEPTIQSAIGALEQGYFLPSGRAGGRAASAWVAFHAPLRQAFDKASADAGVSGTRSARAPWRLHAAAQSLVVSQVRQAVWRFPKPALAQALGQLDELGRTPLSWWTRARVARTRAGSPVRSWGDRAQQVFDLLTPAGAPVWVPGMARHPFLDFLDADAAMDENSPWPPRAVSHLARDFGCLLDAGSCPSDALDQLHAVWARGLHAPAWARLWPALAPSPTIQRVFLLKTLELLAAPEPAAGQPVPGVRWEATRQVQQLLAAWRAIPGGLLGPEALAGPQLVEACDRLLDSQHKYAPGVLALEPLAMALRASRLDASLGPGQKPPAHRPRM